MKGHSHRKLWWEKRTWRSKTKCSLLFDYGDDWEFKVRLEKIEAEPTRLRRPKVVESAGKAPAQYPQIEE